MIFNPDARLDFMGSLLTVSSTRGIEVPLEPSRIKQLLYCRVLDPSLSDEAFDSMVVDQLCVG